MRGERPVSPHPTAVKLLHRERIQPRQAPSEACQGLRLLAQFQESPSDRVTVLVRRREASEGLPLTWNQRSERRIILPDFRIPPGARFTAIRRRFEQC